MSCIPLSDSKPERAARHDYTVCVKPDTLKRATFEYLLRGVTPLDAPVLPAQKVHSTMDTLLCHMQFSLPRTLRIFDSSVSILLPSILIQSDQMLSQLYHFQFLYQFVFVCLLHICQLFLISNSHLDPYHLISSQPSFNS